MARATPSQTVGPFFHAALLADGGGELVTPGDSAAIVLYGRVLDGGGDPVDNGMVEIWLANGGGAYGDNTFARVATAADGGYRFVIRQPGVVPDEEGRNQAPHALLAVFSPGLVRQVLTRVYFANADTAADPLLSSLPAERARRLVAVADDGGQRLDVILQGSNQTPFFEI